VLERLTNDELRRPMCDLEISLEEKAKKSRKEKD
jgi:hypothetical protein